MNEKSVSSSAHGGNGADAPSSSGGGATMNEKSVSSGLEKSGKPS